MADEKFKKLESSQNEISDLSYAIALLGWDQQTYMPVGGAEDRGDQLASLERILHLKITSDEIGKLLEDLIPYAGQLEPDSDEARLIKITRRDYIKRTKVSPDWVAEYARATTVAETAWEHAKQTSNFVEFQPFLETVVRLKREYAQFFAPFEHVYDPLLDDYEPGLKTTELQAIFDDLRPQQVELIRKIMEKPQVDDSFLHQAFPEQEQWDFGVSILSDMGFDWKRGRQDKSVHPFTTSFGLGDVRITTHFNPNHSMSALFSSMHEGGHALYEQGISPKLRRTPLAGGASMAIHESQSRMWENLVGRSESFWSHYYPRLQQKFSSQLGNVDWFTFYKGINKVEPSLVRVEADEATYNLHIMLRMQLEIAMMEGSLEVKDLPEAWNAGMKEYLGLTPPNNALGVLQDVHWSGGSIGYFPTYTLGNLISVQLWKQIHKDIPDLDRQIGNGQLGNLLDWLRLNIHQHGAKFEPQELVQRVTGSNIDAKPYIQYLQEKFGQIYKL
ncbi:MAG TPA: carboxypeptidase M32 [Anaerolineaceae bacterium]|nr:carboxypeptidase M32 [Anaerolineaceae bacterium]